MKLPDGVVKFSAEWCAPCRTLAPVVKNVCSELNVVLTDVDVDANPELAEAVGVRTIPFVIAVRDGQIVDQFTGSVSEARVKKLVEALK